MRLGGRFSALTYFAQLCISTLCFSLAFLIHVV